MWRATSDYSKPNGSLTICWLVVIAGFFAFSVACISVNIDRNLTTCKEWHEVGASDRDEIEDFGLQAIDNMSKGLFADVWEDFVPEFRQQTSLQSFSDDLGTVVRARLGASTYEQVSEGWLLENSDVDVPLVNVICGSIDVDDESHRRITVAASGSKVGVIVVPLTQDPESNLSSIVSVQMAFNNDEWHLTRFDVSSVTLNGSGSAFYEMKGTSWLAQGRYIPAYLAFVNAANLARVSQHVRTGRELMLAEKVQELQRDTQLLHALDSWDVDGISYQIVDIGMIEVLTDATPIVRYVSDLPLSEQSIQPESSRLMELMQAEYAEIFELFDTIVFRAFSEHPVDPMREYSNYTVVLSLED